MQTRAQVGATASLTGRIAIVTGAGSGIGRAGAEVLAAAGATVYCADVHQECSAETAAAIVADGSTAFAKTVDVADAIAVNGLVEAVVEAEGRLDIMCNIAGIMIDGSILDMEAQELDRIIGVNLKGVLFGCQAAGRVMVRQRSGSIINMSSSAAFAPAPNIGAYAMTKAAVIQLTKTMALEVGRHGVRVNSIAPGFVETNMTSRYYRRPDGTLDEELQEQVLAPMRKFAPLRRVGEPRDIAHAMRFLASDESSFMTGQCLSPNGGVAMP